MKNKYLTLLILTLIVFGIYVCIYPPYEGKKNKEGIRKEGHKNDLTNCFDDYDIEPSTLQVKLINDMTNGYMLNQLKRINNKDNRCLYGSMNDARTIWFDFKSLKVFLGHIENEARKRDSNINIDSLGVRIYYVSYPKEGSWTEYDDLKYPPIKNKAGNYEFRHTLIFVPTIKENDIDYDFNPLESNSRLYHISDNDSIMGFTVGGRTNAKNSGSLWPPDDLISDNAFNRIKNGIVFPLN